MISQPISHNHVHHVGEQRYDILPCSRVLISRVILQHEPPPALASPPPEPAQTSDALVLHQEAKSGWRAVPKKHERKPREPRVAKARAPEPPPPQPQPPAPAANIPSWASWKREFILKEYQICTIALTSSCSKSNLSSYATCCCSSHTCWSFRYVI
jgi:hypothetical protein